MGKRISARLHGEASGCWNCAHMYKDVLVGGLCSLDGCAPPSWEKWRPRYSRQGMAGESSTGIVGGPDAGYHANSVSDPRD
jgi:hypothetical protein